jgi:SAM-dependent methyltransferase
MDPNLLPHAPVAPGHGHCPDYPEQVVLFLRKNLLLDADFVVADLGSGTGRFSMLFLAHVKKVYGIEPSDELREKAKNLLPRPSNFVAIKGRAEATGLSDTSVDLVVAGDSFSTFDLEKARAEAKRILRQNRPALVLDRERHADASNFMRAYSDFAKAYSRPGQPDIPQGLTPNRTLSAFFENGFETAVFEQEQNLDLEGLKALYLSSPSAFGPEHPRHGEAMTALRELFDRFEYQGQVAMAYKVHAHIGLFNKKHIALWKKVVFHLLRIPAFFAYLFLITAMFFSGLIKKLRKKLSGR